MPARPPPPAHWGLELLLRPQWVAEGDHLVGYNGSHLGVGLQPGSFTRRDRGRYRVDQRVTPHVPGVGSLQLRKQRSLGLFLGRFEDARGHSCPRLCRRLVFNHHDDALSHVCGKALA